LKLKFLTFSPSNPQLQHHCVSINSLNTPKVPTSVNRQHKVDR
jgi:hypothetical protein